VSPGARRQAEDQALAFALHFGEAPRVPAQWQRFAAQWQRRRDVALQRRQAFERVAGELFGEPGAVLVEEAFARDQARAHRQRQPRAAFVHRQAQPARG
jgi:hypothetical protein